MSIQRERSPSIRSRQTLVKVSQVSKRLPQDFFAPKPLVPSPAKRQQKDVLPSALQNWYEREDSEGKHQHSKISARSKQISRVIPFKPKDESLHQQNSDKQKYYQHLLNMITKKQSIVFKTAKEPKQDQRVIKLERVSTRHQSRRRQSQERGIKSQEKRHRRLSHTPQKERGVVREIRLSLKQLPRRGTSEGRYSNMNVGFDGLLTFNRFE